MWVYFLSELPHSPPTLWTERERYDPGDILRANCSTPPSKPGSTISFLLNNIPVSLIWNNSQSYWGKGCITTLRCANISVFSAPGSSCAVLIRVSLHISYIRYMYVHKSTAKCSACPTSMFISIISI